MVSLTSADLRALSRPLRSAAELTGNAEGDLQSLLTRGEVLIRLQPNFARVQDARDAFLLAVNLSLRFARNIAVQLPSDADSLLEECNALASSLHGPDVRVRLARDQDWDRPVAILNVGTEVRTDLPWTAVNSGGWLARMTTAPMHVSLPYTPAPPNALGALAAACLGMWPIFARLVGIDVVPWRGELSLLTGEIGALATLAEGPHLPHKPLTLRAFVIGAGAVTNGWAYAVKRLPVKGALDVVDRESVGTENLGPYVIPRRADLGHSKARLVSEYLEGSFAVDPRPEELEFFKIRMRYGLELPSLVINGLDNVEARHAVQRLWPDAIIDMGAGGTTLQSIVWQRHQDGTCLLGALTRPAEGDYADRLAAETGLSAQRIRSGPTSAITEADVATAPAGMRAGLEAARSRGQLLCGRITEQLLAADNPGDDFAPAVPFVTGLSGIIGAAETMKWLLGISRPRHYQFDFRSLRGRALNLRCDADCACVKVQGVHRS
jgi:hypothetical protein